MRIPLRKGLVSIMVLVLLALVVGCKQGGGDDATKAPEKPKSSDSKKSAPDEPETKAEKPSGLPALDDVEGFRGWLKMNRKPVEGRTHGRTNIYINQTRAKIAPDGELTFPFPDGTVIVKEILDSDLIAIMRKAEGADPDHNDWQWIEYGSGGSVAGKDESCWGCHSGTKITDYVFTTLDNP